MSPELWNCEGPFEMVGRIGNQQDRYGRDLRVVRRVRADGSIQSIADDMREWRCAAVSGWAQGRVVFG